MLGDSLGEGLLSLLVILSRLKLLLFSKSNRVLFFREVDASFGAGNVRRLCWRIEVRRLSGGEFGIAMERREDAPAADETVSIISSLIGDARRRLMNERIQQRLNSDERYLPVRCREKMFAADLRC